MVWNPIKQTSDVFADMKKYPKYYWMAISACWGGMLFGWDSGLIGGLLNLKSFKTSFELTGNQAAYADLQGWIVSTLQAGCFFGAMSAAFIAEKVGRRGGLFVAAFFFHLGSVLQTTTILGSQSPSAGLTQLYIGRAIGGYGVGMVSVIVPTYIAESSPKHIRGRLTGLYQLAIVTGIALSFWVNYGMIQQFGDVPDREVIWRAPFALQHIPGVLLVVTMFFEKESPRWLSEKGRWDEARAVIARLSKKSQDDPDVIRECEEIRHDLEKHVRLGFGQQFKEVFGSGGAHFYRCSLPFIMMFWQQWTGVNSMNYYSPQIFRELGLNGTSAGLLGTGIYGIVKIVMTLLVLSWGMEQYGRKALLVWGGVGQALPMFYIAGYRHIREGSTTVDGASYVAIVMIYLYVTFYSFGWSVAPWPAMSETQPNHLRSLTMSIGLMSNWLFNFTISKITPILLQRIKWGTYLLFGCTTLSAALWAVLFFPETGGYKIEDMHTLFEGNIIRRSLRDNRYLFKQYNNAAEMSPVEEKVSDLETSSASDRSDNGKN